MKTRQGKGRKGIGHGACDVEVDYLAEAATIRRSRASDKKRRVTPVDSDLDD